LSGYLIRYSHPIAIPKGMILAIGLRSDFASPSLPFSPYSM
jgi:hypothetical protein